MTAFTVLCDKAKDLCAGLKPKQRNAVPPEVIAEACRTIDHLRAALLPYLPPSSQEKREAKSHPKGSQITLFTAADRERKRYFNLAYFQNKFRGLPRDKRRLIVSTVPKTVAGLRDALILYWYRAGKQAGQDLLTTFLADLENEYHSLPQVQHYNRLKSLYRELLAVRTPANAVSRLSAEFAEEKDLLAFAKVNKLKIPAQKRGKNAPRSTPHERLAEVIFEKGSLVRLDIE
jgi:hypothetical protein